MKKVFFGLAVAAVALSASAFTNAKGTSRFATLYYQTSPGVYTSNPGTGLSCETPTTLPCILQFPSDVPDVVTFTYGSQQYLDIVSEVGAPISQEGTNRLYQ